MNDSVKVTILGSEYSLRTNDEQLLRELAEDVDSELKDLQQKLPNQPPTKLAVLAALNTSEKFSHARSDELREIERVTSEVNALSDELEKLVV
jgi:cell division protein ZapA (FtsZ GTPase activity inhibitor)